MTLEPPQRSAGVLEFPRAVIVRTRTLSHSPKVEPQDRGAERMERCCGAVHDLVVQRSAVERMRMTHHHRESGRQAVMLLKQRFD